MCEVESMYNDKYAPQSEKTHGFFNCGMYFYALCDTN